MPGSIEIEIPVRTFSEANMRDHWRKRAERARGQRDLACKTALTHPRWSRVKYNAKYYGCTIELIRMGKTKKMDDDNLVRSLKAVRDGIADALLLDDGDIQLTWKYDQSIKNKKYSVICRVVFNDKEEGEKDGEPLSE